MVNVKVTRTERAQQYSGKRSQSSGRKDGNENNLNGRKQNEKKLVAR
jgi:hypothetical protein